MPGRLRITSAGRRLSAERAAQALTTAIASAGLDLTDAQRSQLLAAWLEAVDAERLVLTREAGRP